MQERIRLVILILGVAIVWYIFIGSKVDENVRRYPITAPAAEEKQPENQ